MHKTKSIPKMSLKAQMRFWSMVADAGNNDCWQWIGAKNSGGYGLFHILRKNYLSHRISFFLAIGIITKDCVCHSCDCPPCCNPRHLWIGSKADNSADMRSKGRGSSIHKERDATESFGMNVYIARMKLGISQAKLASMAGSRPSVISDIERNRRSPLLRTIERIATALDFDPLDLIS